MIIRTDVLFHTKRFDMIILGVWFSINSHVINFWST